MESDIVFGPSAALLGRMTIRNGKVQQMQQIFRDHPVARMNRTSEVHATMMKSATPPIAPAVANAVFELNSNRLRSMPLRPA